MYKDLDPAEAAAQRHQKKDIDVMWEDTPEKKAEDSQGTPNDKAKVTDPKDNDKSKKKRSKGTKLLVIILIGLLIFFGITIAYLLFFWEGSTNGPIDQNDSNNTNNSDQGGDDNDGSTDNSQNDQNNNNLTYIFPYELNDRDIEIRMEYEQNKSIDADTIGKVYKMNFDGAILRIYVKEPHRGLAESMVGGSQGVLIEDGVYRVKAKDIENLGSNTVWGYHLMIGDTKSACSIIPTPCYDEGFVNHKRYGSIEISLTYPKSFDKELETEIQAIADSLVRSLEIEESISAKYLGDATNDYPERSGYVYFEKCYELEDLCEQYLMKPDQAQLVKGKLDDTQRGGQFLLTGFLYPTTKVDSRTSLFTFSGDVIVDQEEEISFDDGDSNKYFDAMYMGDASDVAYEYSGYVHFQKCDVRSSSCNAYLLDKSIAAKYNYFLGDSYLEKDFLIKADLSTLGAAGGTSYYMLTGDIDIKLLD